MGQVIPLLLRPGSRRALVNWAIEEKSYSQRRACGLIGLDPKTYRYASRPPDDVELRARLKALASERRRFGYRRLHILLKREGVALNHKKLFRLYREERLTVRRRGGRKRALGTRAPMTIPQGPNQRWSLDFVSDTLLDGRRFRILAGGRRLHPGVPGAGGRHVAVGRPGRPRADALVGVRGRPLMIVSDNGTELDLACDPALAGGPERRLALHRSRQADAERLRREPDRPASATNASTSTCSAACRRRAGSSKLGGSTTTPADRTRASAASPQSSSQTGPGGTTSRTKSSYERGQIGGNVRSHAAHAALGEP